MEISIQQKVKVLQQYCDELINLASIVEDEVVKSNEPVYETLRAIIQDYALLDPSIQVPDSYQNLIHNII